MKLIISLISILLLVSDSYAQIKPKLDQDIQRSMFQEEAASSRVISEIYVQLLKSSKILDSDPKRLNKLWFKVCLADAMSLGIFSKETEITKEDSAIIEVCQKWASKPSVVSGRNDQKTPFTYGKFNAGIVLMGMEYVLDYLDQVYKTLSSPIKMEVASCVMDKVRVTGDMQSGLELIKNGEGFGECARTLEFWLKSKSGVQSL